MNDKYAMTYGTLEIFTYPDGTSETLNFPEAQKKYGDLLERADMQVKERFASCLTHFKARNNIGRNGFELQKLLATIKTIRIYTDHNEYTEGVITFGEAQERFGMDLELLTTEQRQKFAKELVKYHELTEPKKKEEKSIMIAENSTKDTMCEYDSETNAEVKCVNTDSDIKGSNVRKPKDVWIIIETRCSVDSTSSIRDLESDVFGDLHYSSLDAEATLNEMYEEYLRINKTMNLGLVLDFTHDEDGLNPVFQSRFLRRNSGCPDIETIVRYTIKKLEVYV